MKTLKTKCKRGRSRAGEAIERLYATIELGLCLIYPAPADGLLCQAGRRRALLRLPAPLSGAKSSLPQSGAACAWLHTHGGRHQGTWVKPWVLCPAPCLVHIAACRCA